MGGSVEDAVRAYVGAFARGDVDTAGKYLADDIVYHVGGHHSLAGDYRGRDAVLAFFKNRSARTGGTFAYEPHDLLASSDHAVALGSVTALRGDDVYSWNIVTVYHVRDDRVSECWIVDVDPDTADSALAE